MAFVELIDSLVGVVERRPVPTPPRPVSLPDDDDPDEDVQGLGYAEGQSFVIEYHDSRGRSSRRRITVFEIVQGRSGIPSLFAKCHDRGATRQFRVDRISCCIDYDGEIHDDVAAFLAATFGMAENLARRRSSPDSDGRWTDIVSLIRPRAVLLTALSQCDGATHPAETAEAAQYLALEVERSGVFLSEAEVERIAAYLKRMRPTADAISRALSSLEGHPVASLRRFLMAAARVVEADGRRHPQEISLIDEICRELTGAALN